jgi:hypothetical protein
MTAVRLGATRTGNLGTGELGIEEWRLGIVLFWMEL